MESSSGPMPHMSEKRLAAYIDGDLPPAEATKVEEHLMVCSVCREEVTEVSRVLRGDRRQKARRTFIPVLGVAAAAVLVFLFPVVVNRNQIPEDVLRTGPGVTGLETLPVISPLTPILERDSSSLYRLELQWEPHEGASEYRATLTDSAGETVWTGTTQQTRIGIPSDVQLEPGALLFWYVDAVLSSGQLATTGVQRLRIPESEVP